MPQPLQQAVFVRVPSVRPRNDQEGHHETSSAQVSPPYPGGTSSVTPQPATHETAAPRQRRHDGHRIKGAPRLHSRVRPIPAHTIGSVRDLAQTPPARPFDTRLAVGGITQMGRETSTPFRYRPIWPRGGEPSAWDIPQGSPSSHLRYTPGRGQAAATRADIIHGHTTPNASRLDIITPHEGLNKLSNKCTIDCVFSPPPSTSWQPRPDAPHPLTRPPPSRHHPKALPGPTRETDETLRAISGDGLVAGPQRSSARPYP